MDADVYCMDLDFTLIRYLPAFTQLTYRVLAGAMVRRGHSSMLLDPLWEKRALEFTQNGLVADLARGNVLSLGKNCEVIRCFHGFTVKTETEVCETYGESPSFDITSSHRVPGHYWCFLTHFACSQPAIYTACIELISRQITPSKSFSDLENDLLASVLEIFDTPQGEATDKAFYVEIYHHPGKYIRTEPKVKELLRTIEKIKVIVTNSYEEYTSFVCEYALGRDWKELFDCVVVGAGKPNYFTPGIPGRRQPSGLILGGSCRDLLEKYPNKSFLFIGDHFLSDVCAPKASLNWLTIAILSEIESENASPPKYVPHFGLFLQEDNYWIHLVLSNALRAQPSLESLLLLQTN